MELFRSHVLVCGGTGCTSSGSDLIIEQFEKQLADHDLENEIKVIRTGCFGLCEAGPVVIVYPEGTFYSHVKPADVKEIVEEHLLKGRVVRRLVYAEKANIPMQENPLMRYPSINQTRVALRNCGVIDPKI